MQQYKYEVTEVSDDNPPVERQVAKTAYGFSGHEFFVFMKNLRAFAPIGEALIVRTNDPDYRLLPRPTQRFKAREKIEQILGEEHHGHEPTTIDLLRQDRLMIAKNLRDPKVDLKRLPGEVVLGLVTTAFVFNVQRPFIQSPRLIEPELVEALSNQFYDEGIGRIAQQQITP